MLFLHDLVNASDKIRSTTKKKEKIEEIVRVLREAREQEISLAADYLAGQIPQGRMGVGWAMVQEALKGLASAQQPLSVIELDKLLEAITGMKGAGSTGTKIKSLREIFSRITEGEKRFLIGLLMGEIRQGALEGMVLEAIARASSLPLENVRDAYMFSGDAGVVARAAAEEGLPGLHRFGPQLFRPISPMLASSAEEESEALSRLGEAGWEYKIDGARIQVHKDGDEVRIFSRRLREITESVPEVTILARNLPMERAIFEGEAIALREDGRPLPFQTTMRRLGRIKDREQMEKEIPLTPFFFDLLYLDGEILLHTPYEERFRELSARVPDKFIIPRVVTADRRAVQDFLTKSLRAGHEGLMAKGLDTPYAAGQRGFFWLKLKPAHTLDLAVLAAEWGHGRRRGFLSNLHLGARDPGQNSYVMLGKTFKGLTDEMLRWQTQKLLSLEIARDDWTVFVRPELVVEIAFNNIQESPRYPAGWALRFARVKRYREDKTPLEADTIDRVRSIFEAERK